MTQEFFEAFPTLLGLHSTPEIRPQQIKGTTLLYADKRANYVARYYGIAEKVGRAFGINPIVILAQGAIESGWGTSNLATNYNNFFGITAYGATNNYWTGSKYISSASNLPFRTYATVMDSFSDFARLLISKYSTAARASKNVAEYASLIASSPYINEKNGDNRAKYKQLIIQNAILITAIRKKFLSLYN